MSTPDPSLAPLGVWVVNTTADGALMDLLRLGLAVGIVGFGVVFFFLAVVAVQTLRG